MSRSLAEIMTDVNCRKSYSLLFFIIRQSGSGDVLAASFSSGISSSVKETDGDFDSQSGDKCLMTVKMAITDRIEM